MYVIVCMLIMCSLYYRINNLFTKYSSTNWTIPSTDSKDLWEKGYRPSLFATVSSWVHQKQRLLSFFFLLLFVYTFCVHHLSWLESSFSNFEYVPCSSRTLAIMTLHGIIFFIIICELSWYSRKDKYNAFQLISSRVWI